MLGTIHAGVSLSELPCHESIENKLKESGLVFLESHPKEQEDFNLLLNLSVEDQKKLYIGSKREKDEIMKSLSKETKKMIQDRINIEKLIKIMGMKERSKFIREKNQGKFEDLDKKSQDFLKRYGLYNKDKFFYDYFFDIMLMNFFDAGFEVSGSILPEMKLSDKLLDDKIGKLSIENDIFVRLLDDDNEQILRDLKEEMEKREEVEVGIKQELTAENIDHAINQYDGARTILIEWFNQQKIVNQTLNLSIVFNYKEENWSYFDNLENTALLKNRNESWVEKILSSLENEDKAFTEHKSFFIAAGVLHFVGSDNVIDMLKGEGFKIRKINEESCQF